MSHEGKSGKRKLTQNKTKNKASPAPPAPMPEPPENEASTLAGTNVNLEAYIWQENVEGKRVLKDNMLLISLFYFFLHVIIFC